MVAIDYQQKKLPEVFYEKIGSGIGVFLSILRNFYEHLFYRTLPGDCFCINIVTWLMENTLRMENHKSTIDFTIKNKPLSIQKKCCNRDNSRLSQLISTFVNQSIVYSKLKPSASECRSYIFINQQF